MRDGEVDGRDYHFITDKEFWEMLQNDEFIEYRKYDTLVNGKPDTWYYGIKKQQLPLDERYVVVLDLGGAQHFIEHYGEDNCFMCYVDAPESVRRQRAEARGSFDETEWNRRVEADDNDFTNALVNASVRTAVMNIGELEECVREIHARFYLFCNIFS
jgi:guanylate kinase